MLQAKTKEQKECVQKILGCTSMWFSKENADGIYIDDWVSFDEMSEIVDYLRKEDNVRRDKARRAGMNSCIDGLWISENYIFFECAEKEKAVKFIKSLVKFGYDEHDLMEEYNNKKWITI